MNDNSYLKELTGLPQSHPLFQSVHPFWRKCFRGRLSRPVLRAWAADVMPFVRDFAPMYMHVAIQCPDRKSQTFLGETIHEETGSGVASKHHALLFENFAVELGIDRESLAGPPPGKEGKAILDYTWQQARSGDFVTGLACLGIGIERPSPMIFPLVARALQRHYRLSPDAVQFFVIHGPADIKHSQLAATLLAQHAKTEADRDRIRTTVAGLWDLQLAHLDRLERIAAEEQATAPHEALIGAA